MSYPYIEGLLKNLNEHEQSSILDYFNSSGSEKAPVSLNYLSALFHKETNASETPKINNTLRSRLFDKTIEALTTQRHISNKALFNEHEQLVFLLKKRILHFRILFKSPNPGKVNSLKSILNGIIKDAKENEIYDVLIEALILKKYFIGIRSGKTEFERIHKEILFYEQAYHSLLFASDSYYRFILSTKLLKSFSDFNYRVLLTKCIRKIKADLIKNRSQQVNYYLHILLLIYSERNKKYTLAVKYCKKLIAIVSGSRIVYRKERLGFAYDNLSQYKTFTGNFNEAAKFAKQAQTYYSINGIDYLVSKEQEFHVYFYHGKYEKAIVCSNELVEHPLSDVGKFRKSKFVYSQACVYFAQKKYKNALALLKKSLELEKDKTRWNVSLKILYVMIFIELNKTDEATNALESLRKYMARNKKDMKLRDVKIVKVLREMEKNDFVLNEKNQTIKKLWKELAASKTKISWEFYTPELNPFHKWLAEKTKK